MAHAAAAVHAPGHAAVHHNAAAHGGHAQAGHHGGHHHRRRHEYKKLAVPYDQAYEAKIRRANWILFFRILAIIIAIPILWYAGILPAFLVWAISNIVVFLVLILLTPL